MFKLAAISLGTTSTFNSTFETKFSNYGDAYQMNISEKDGANTLAISVTQPQTGSYTVTLTRNNDPLTRQTYKEQLFRTNFTVVLGQKSISLKVCDIINKNTEFYPAK